MIIDRRALQVWAGPVTLNGDVFINVFRRHILPTPALLPAREA